jgi:hypothetical protein
MEVRVQPAADFDCLNSCMTKQLHAVLDNNQAKLLLQLGGVCR